MSQEVNNRIVALLTHVVSALVNEPDKIEIQVDEGDYAVVLELKVAPDDMGRIIGKHGRIAKAIRTVVKAAAGNEKKKYSVEIL